jgi:1-phosphofructokinase family hexose kinase
MAIMTIGFNPAIDRILECPDFHIGGHQHAFQIARLASGKAANVNRALAQLGTDSIATGFVGSDELEFYHQQLMSTGPGRILCRFVEVGGQTRENITILDPKRHVETHLRDRGFTVTEEEARLLEQKILHELKEGDLAIFSGSLSPGISDRFFVDLLEKCRAAGARVAVDSNGSPLQAAAKKSGLWMLKPNMEELRQLLGVEVPNAAAAVRDAAMPLLATIENVLVSRGPAGAVLLTRESGGTGGSGGATGGGGGAVYSARITSREPPVRTVGCGDHLLAGFVSQMMAGAPPARALEVAMAVATARALSPRMEEFDPAQMERAAAMIVVERM